MDLPVERKNQNESILDELVLKHANNVGILSWLDVPLKTTLFFIFMRKVLLPQHPSLLKHLAWRYLSMAKSGFPHRQILSRQKLGRPQWLSTQQLNPLEAHIRSFGPGMITKDLGPPRLPSRGFTCYQQFLPPNPSCPLMRAS